MPSPPDVISVAHATTSPMMAITAQIGWPAASCSTSKLLLQPAVLRSALRYLSTGPASLIRPPPTVAS